MLSLKPPWKQKNPTMEKACPTYHKNTAPDDIVEFVDKLTVRSEGRTLQKEIVDNGKDYIGGGKTVPASFVLFKDKGAVKGFMRISNAPDKFYVILCKTDWSGVTIKLNG